MFQVVTHHQENFNTSSKRHYNVQVLLHRQKTLLVATHCHKMLKEDTHHQYMLQVGPQRQKLHTVITSTVVHTFRRHCK